MSILTLLVFGLEEHEQPYHLASVKVEGDGHTAFTRLSDAQLFTLVQQLEAGEQPIGDVYSKFRLQYLFDGIPVGIEDWTIAVLPGAWRNLELPDGRLLRLENDYFDDRLPVLSL